MNLRHLALFAAFVVVACTPSEELAEGDGTWVGDITTHENVTTVLNESGSVWGGPARLIEEASIGVEAGEDPYMLGNIEGVAVAGERIYVLDRTVNTVRVYDLSGSHLMDVGRAGQGPGEFENPYLLAVSPAGDVAVRTFAGVELFDSDGTHLRSVNEPGGIILPFLFDNDGTVYVPASWADDASGSRQSGHVTIRPDGSRGERIPGPSLVDWRPWALMAQGNGRSRQQSVPFSPSTVSTLAPSGAVVQGASDAYRLEVRNPDGSVRVIERRVDGLPVSGVELAWHEAMTELIMRRLQPDWTWNANPIPATKPFFRRFYVDTEGVLWVRRIVRSEAVPDCDANPGDAIAEERPPVPCFRDIEGFDVFGQDGRFHGSVELPAMSLVAEPAILGDTVLLAGEDESGVIMVKRYRLLRPEDSGQ